MAIETTFTVKNEDFDRLSPDEAVSCFRDLLWAEARKIGIPLNHITGSSSKT